MTMIAPAASPHPTYRSRPEYKTPKITPRQRRKQQHAMRHFTGPIEIGHAQALQGRLDQAMKLRPVERIAFDRQYT